MTQKKWLRKFKIRFRAFSQTLVHLGHRAKIQLAQTLRMVYSISPKRAALLEENFFEFSSQNRVPDRALFDSITDPA